MIMVKALLTVCICICILILALAPPAMLVAGIIDYKKFWPYMDPGMVVMGIIGGILTLFEIAAIIDFAIGW